MSCRTEVADFWDSVLEGWRADPELKDVPEVLREWRKSYAGEVDLRHYPEGFVGDLRGEQREPRIVVLGLNPGIGYEPLTGAHGKWVQAIKEHSYSRSSQHRVPFENADWRKLHNGKDSLYWVRLINFARRWFGDDRAGVADVLNFEMFPFHSNNLKANIRPPMTLSIALCGRRCRRWRRKSCSHSASPGTRYARICSATRLRAMARAPWGIRPMAIGRSKSSLLKRNTSW